ncbi:hypothetical protein [Arthrobacter sp. MMS18-M83]|uniref:hypothetical protein n=1 Tax=Arthrobacter sp. MMS18-M83 TaxID=2996261 RepID=UPI00227A9110|nr:hypothetical protein [Arthrobacter sp. MMS18-M83]WAH97270.1 hypothetical protein OW521_23510 [Arthrobacter sp. MMS18-M83]
MANYRALGYRRMIYTNTVIVRSPKSWQQAVGDESRITAVLLTASDEAGSASLRGRIKGNDLQDHLDRSNAAVMELELLTPDWVHRTHQTISTSRTSRLTFCGSPDGPPVCPARTLLSEPRVSGLGPIILLKGRGNLDGLSNSGYA